VITYDRRGFTRSERPQPYSRVTVAEHAADAAALLDALGAIPAVVVGRSYGGNIALELALRHPGRARALVLLEGGGEALSAEVRAFVDALIDRIRAAVVERGPAAAGVTLWRGVLGDDDYEALPEDTKARVAANGPAVLAELEGFMDGQPDLAQLRTITCPALVVAAMASPPAFRSVSEDLAAALPGARLALVEGGHLITPADPQVVRFLQEVLALV
jgi:pimeloyl-ACP methyl ester carboxylesterase